MANLTSASGSGARSFGAFSAFLVALFTEMYGFPLTLYFLSGCLLLVSAFLVNLALSRLVALELEEPFLEDKPPQWFKMGNQLLNG